MNANPPGTPRGRIPSRPWEAALVVLVALLLLPPALTAQSLVAVEGSLPWARPVSTFGEQGADPGIGVGGQVVVRVFSPVLVWAGWDRTSFDCPTCSPSGDVTLDGLALGMEAQLNPDSRWRPWFRAGAARRNVEADVGTIESSEVWAIQVATGLLVRLVPALDLRAGARFETLDPGLDLGTDLTELGTPVSYVAIEMGLRLRVIP
jgi:hypothetical protein